MSDKKIEHTFGRDCWCNPLIVTAGSKTITEYAGTVVKYEPIAHDMIAVHIEPHPAEEEEPA